MKNYLLGILYLALATTLGASDACVVINNIGGITLYGGRWYNSGGSPVGGSGTVTVSPGGSQTLTMTGYGGTAVIQNIKFGYYTNAALTGTRIYHPSSGTYAANFGSTVCPTVAFTYDVPTAGTADPSTNMCTMTFIVRNNSATYRWMSLWRDGEDLGCAGGSLVGGYSWPMDPGEMISRQFTDYCTNINAHQWSVGYASCDLLYSQYDPRGTNYTTVTNNPAGNTNGTPNVVTPPAPGQFDPGGGKVGSNILWSMSSATNVIISQQEGDAALYDVMSKHSAANDANLRNINSNISRLIGVVGGLTNGTSDIGVSNALWLTHGSLTNFINGFSTNSLDVGSMTGTVMQAWGEAMSKAAQENFELEGTLDIVKGLTIEDAPAGDSSPLQFSWGGVDWDFDPSHYVNPGFIYQLFAWVLAAAYLIKIIGDIMKWVHVLAAANQVKTPYIDANVFGFGGNFGIMLIPVFVGAFLVAYGAFIGIVTSELGTAFSGTAFSYLTSGPLSGGSGGGVSVAVAIYLIQLYFPIDLLVSLTAGYIIFRATMVSIGMAFALTLKLFIS